MANSFSKEERVAFEDILEGFNDALVMSSNVEQFPIGSPESAERADDTLWRPQPYVGISYDGEDQTANFKGYTQLSVPATVGYEKSVPWLMTATQLRDALQANRLGESAKQRLASDINSSVLSVAANYGTLVVKRTAAASGYDDVAQCDSLMNEQGVNMEDRRLFLSSRDYNGMASNLAARQTMNEKPTKAYEKSYVGEVSSFETFKLDYSRRLAAAGGGGGLTIDTRASANNYYTPVAVSTAAAGQKSNVDNRFQTITLSSTTNVAAGDCFTIAGVNAVHHIEKGDTGQLKTFRVVSVDSSTTMTISPPIVSNQGGTQAEEAYQNTVVTPAASAAITFLNTVAASVNPFFVKKAIELHPSSYAVPADQGVAVMKGVTDQGIELVMTKQFDQKTFKSFFRCDVRYGVTMVQPEMAGIMLFSQT